MAKKAKKGGKGKAQPTPSTPTVTLTPEEQAAKQAERQRQAQQKALASLYGQGVQAAKGYINENMQGDFLGRMQNPYTAAAYQAQREQLGRGIQSNTQTSLSQLARAQARGKVYGAAAGAQQSNLIRAGEEQQGNMEQDLYLKSLAEGQNVEKFNLGQKAAEESARAGAFMGIAGLGATKESEEAMRKLYEKALKSM